MYLRSDTLDDLLRSVFDRLESHGAHIAPTRGPATELTGVLLELTNPRARLSRTESRGMLFSCLGELLWYLAKSDCTSFIGYYILDYLRQARGKDHVEGAYGPRLFGLNGAVDQMQNVVSLLRTSESSRKAVVQVFAPHDLDADVRGMVEDVPCTCTLHFLLRNRLLHLVVYMRSNDVILGLPHDVFAFTMLQEIIARSLGVEVGSYKHCVGSLHLYDRDKAIACAYMREGWQSTKSPMPAMPTGNPWPSIAAVLDAEAEFRSGSLRYEPVEKLDDYWLDLIRLLRIFGYYRHRGLLRPGEARSGIAMTKAEMKCPVYNTYIARKQDLERDTAGRIPK